MYYELLKPDETIVGHPYRQQLIKLNRALEEERPQYDQGRVKVFFQHGLPKCVKNYLENVKINVLSCPPNSPDLSPSYYHLFKSMQHEISEQHVHFYEKNENLT